MPRLEGTGEPWPIAVNAASEYSIAPYDYVCEAVLPEGTPAAASATGCPCSEGVCSAGTCTCAAECSAGLTALQAGGEAGVVCLLECGPACACGPQCGARPSQSGVAVELCISQMPGKGWGVLSKQPLPTGTFVCCYHGEFLRNEQADARLAEYDQQLSSEGEGHALLVLRVVLPSGRSALRLNIDATRRGNMARFINHRCGGGNLTPIITMYKGCLVPRVALFANRHISAGEELTFAYGAPNAGPPAGERHARCARPCRCGSQECLGFLPADGV